MEKTDRGLEISVDDNGHGFGFVGSYSLEELELLRLGPASLKRRARSLECGSGGGIASRQRVGSQVQDSADVSGKKNIMAADEHG